MNLEDVRPGDRVILTNRGKEFGGTVWLCNGSLVAGDTFLTLHGEWIPTQAKVVRIDQAEKNKVLASDEEAPVSLPTWVEERIETIGQ